MTKQETQKITRLRCDTREANAKNANYAAWQIKPYEIASAHADIKCHGYRGFGLFLDEATLASEPLRESKFKHVLSHMRRFYSSLHRPWSMCTSRELHNASVHESLLLTAGPTETIFEIWGEHQTQRRGRKNIFIIFQSKKGVRIQDAVMRGVWESSPRERLPQITFTPESAPTCCRKSFRSQQRKLDCLKYINY